MKGFGERHQPPKKKNSTNDETTTRKKIINRAFECHSLGKIREAKKYYENFINQGFLDHRVFANYGMILNNLGELQEAEIYIRKAIELNPNYAIAHSNLGGILKHVGELQEAEICTRKAIELQPNYSKLHLNLGLILQDVGKLKEAELAICKAIELNHNYADAYSDLRNILQNLGKLEKLIQISKSIIESKSFDIGYKLQALLSICITNLLLNNFSETYLNINKIDELINKGALNMIQDKRIRKHTFIFSRFISCLYPLLEKNNKNINFEKIPHFGESHCLSFTHQIVSVSSKLKQIQPVLIKGAKAWHFAKDEMNKWKDSLNQQIKSHTYSDTVFISFGEIDCRKDEGILSFMLKNSKCISEVCNDTINRFLNYMEITLSPNYSKRYYFGVPAPSIKTKIPDELDIKRIKIIKIYNSLLKEKVLSKGSYFIDVYELTSTIDGLNNNIHMCDKTHLSPKCLSILFENHLYRR